MFDSSEVWRRPTLCGPLPVHIYTERPRSRRFDPAKNAMGFRRGRPNSPYSEAPPIAGRDTNGRFYQGTFCAARKCLNCNEGKKKSRGFIGKLRRETRE